MTRGFRSTVAAEGFTLVEVMVALTILSLVMMATVTGLRTLANTQSAIERMTSRVDEVRSVSIFLRDLLTSASSGTDPNKSNIRRPRARMKAILLAAMIFWN